MRRIAVLSTLLLSAVASSSCGLLHPDIDRGPLDLIGPEKRSVEGRKLEYFVFGEGDRTVLYLATIHGDEPAGTPLLERFMDELEANPKLTSRVRAVVVPVVNPDGLASATRRNANGIDLNRNFPAANYKQTTTHGPRPLSEPEASFVHQLVGVAMPELIVTIHQPAERIDYDGPAASIAYRLAGVCDLPVRRMGARQGSLGSWAGNDEGIAVITVELPRSADDLESDEAWEAYGPLLLEALR